MFGCRINRRKRVYSKVFTCESLQKWNEIEPLLKQYVPDDKKWIIQKGAVFQNLCQKQGRRQRCLVTTDWFTLSTSISITMRHRIHLPELVNKRGFVFRHDRARPHTHIASRQKLRELSWAVYIVSRSDFALSSAWSLRNYHELHYGNSFFGFGSKTVDAFPQTYVTGSIGSISACIDRAGKTWPVNGHTGGLVVSGDRKCYETESLFSVPGGRNRWKEHSLSD